MHGHHGFGGGWGHGAGRGFGGGWGRGFGGGFGLGWIFPALLVGRVISEAFDRPADPAPPTNWPPQPAAPALPLDATQPHAAVRLTTITCQGCGRQIAGSHAFCPECGTRVSPAGCRYCGQVLQPNQAICAHCGGPRR